VPNARAAVIAVLLVLPLVLGTGACGSDDGGDDARGTTPGGADATATRLTVTGVKTAATSEPVPEPTEIPFSWTLDCTTDPPSGTGAYADSATQTCEMVEDRRAELALLDPRPGRVCTEIYGGPQLARITGTVAGTAVNVEIARNDGCGIDDWTRLEWLLGPPEV
jgi:hypothetical protein